MSMRKLWLLLQRIVFSGSTAKDYHERFANLPHRHSHFDITLGWEIKQDEKEAVVEGVAKNLRYCFMEGVEFWVYGLDPAGNTVAHSASCLIPHQLKQGEVAPFTVKLPVVMEPGMLLRFTYRYEGSDGGDGGERRMESFDWIVPAP